MRALFILLILLGINYELNAQRRRLVEIDADTVTAASAPSLTGLAATNNTLYLVPFSGPNVRMAKYSELISLSVPAWSNITGKPSTFPFVSDFNAKFDSVRAIGFSVDNLSIDNEFVVNGYTDLNSGRLNSFIIEEIADGTDNYGNNGEVLVKRGSMKWDSLEVVDIVGMNEYVRADTLGGRAVFQLPSYVADLIPDSSHITIEPDFIKAYQINGAFGTVPLGYPVVSVGLDSTEITLPKPNYDLVWEIFCTCFDDTVFGVYDTVQYKIPVQGGDSITMHKPQSILYFSDTIWVDAGNTYKFTNYLSNEHPINQFRSGNHYLGSRIAWDNKQQKFFIQ